MQIAFLIIITLLGTGYAFWTKQTKVAAGFLLLTISFVLTIPDIVTGFWVDILLALSLMVFTAGVFVIIYKKKQESPILTESDPKPLETPKENEIK
jgi:hypothetical protein